MILLDPLALAISFFILFYRVDSQTTHQTALQVTRKAERMMEEQHYSSEQVRATAECITTRWQQLMFRAEERMKLVMASNHWFKTAEQVSQSSESSRVGSCLSVSCLLSSFFSFLSIVYMYVHTCT